MQVFFKLHSEKKVWQSRIISLKSYDPLQLYVSSLKKTTMHKTVRQGGLMFFQKNTDRRTILSFM